MLHHRAENDSYGLDFDVEASPVVDQGSTAADDRPRTEAIRLASACCIALDWTQELGFTAACVEHPTVTARAASPDLCIARLGNALVGHLDRLIREKRLPRTPRSEAPRFHARTHMGELRPHMNLVSDRADDLADLGVDWRTEEPLIPPTESQARRMAQWTAAQYRLILQRVAASGGWRATCGEVRGATGRGATPGACVADVRRQLTERVAEMIRANVMPPEPLQDLERRRAALRPVRASRLAA